MSPVHSSPISHSALQLADFVMWSKRQVPYCMLQALPRGLLLTIPLSSLTISFLPPFIRPQPPKPPCHSSAWKDWPHLRPLPLWSLFLETFVPRSSTVLLNIGVLVQMPGLQGDLP